MCRKPFISGSAAFGCGQCLPCRLNRRRLWTHRLMLESLLHGDNCFVTLTYDDDHLPADGSLDYDELRNFIKRLRENLAPVKIRYYAVGEYGDISWRPHYHLAVFGIGESLTSVIEKSWGKGFCYVGDLTLSSAQYIAGYVTKKLNGRDDRSLDILDGRRPEKAFMSRKPGIGANAMKNVMLALNGYLPDGDVPVSLAHGKKLMPLGRYLRGKMREEFGLDKKAPSEAIEKYSAQMSQLFEEGLSNPKNKNKTFKQIIVESSAQAALNQKTKFEIFKQKKGFNAPI